MKAKHNRLLCVRRMTKRVGKISRRNYKRLLRKLKKNLKDFVIIIKGEGGPDEQRILTFSYRFIVSST